MALIRSLQAGRALAALAVVFHHAGAASKSFAVGMPAWLQPICERGYLGVDFFFVLSGFIIAHTRNHHSSVGDFARSRFIRLFVPYWPVGLAMAAAYLLLPDLSGSDRSWSWLATVTLLPATGNPALVVAWTLQYELLFYAMFALALALGRPLVGILIWGAVVAAYNLLAAEPPASFDPFLNGLALEFVIGVIAAHAVATERLQGAWVLAVATLGLYFALGALLPQRLIFGLAMGFLVVTMVRAERAGRIRVPASLTFLGAASYSIYLVHYPVNSLAARLFDDWLSIFAVTALAGIAGGILYHLAFEKPALRLLGRRRQLPVQTLAASAPAPSKAQG